MHMYIYACHIDYGTQADVKCVEAQYPKVCTQSCIILPISGVIIAVFVRKVKQIMDKLLIAIVKKQESNSCLYFSSFEISV